MTGRALSGIVRLPAEICALLIRGYRRFLSPLLGPHCRFYPTCSAYALEAFTVHGFFKGGFLTARRLLRCGPWSEGGFDPVPPKK